MADSRFKSKSYRRVSKRTPKFGSKTVYTRKKHRKVVCAICGKEIHGLKRFLPSDLRKLAKSQKTIARPYGAYICSECLRKLMKEKARSSKYNQ